jgi:hypothetical protein
MSKSFRKFLLLLTLALTLTLTLCLRPDDFFAVKDQVISESRFKLGFLYFTPLLLLENVGYTSSIYTYQNEEYPDWTGDIGLGVRASAIMANRFILQVEDLPRYSFYLENKGYRTWSNQFEANAYSYVGPFNLKAGFRQHDLHQRPRLEFSRPYHYRDSEWSGEVDIGKRNRLFVTAYASFNKSEYDDDPYLGNFNLAERLNHREDTFGFRLNKPIFTSTIVYANYERTDYKFAESLERNSQAQQIALGVQFPEMGALQGSFQIGIRRFEPGNPLYQITQRANGRGDVSLALAERIRLNAFYEISTRFSFYSSDVFYDDYSFGGGAQVYLTRFLKVGGTYRDGRLKYYSFIDLQPQRSDRIRQQQYFIAIPFLGNTSLGFAYNVYRLTSDVLNLDYTRSFWGGFLTYGF